MFLIKIMMLIKITMLIKIMMLIKIIMIHKCEQEIHVCKIKIAGLPRIYIKKILKRKEEEKKTKNKVK
jgi:hypothetical protein